MNPLGDLSLRSASNTSTSEDTTASFRVAKLLLLFALVSVMSKTKIKKKFTVSTKSRKMECKSTADAGYETILIVSVWCYS